MASNPLVLSDYILLAETIQLTGNGLTGAQPYRSITRTGVLPLATGVDAAGPVLDIRDGKASVATEGYAIVELSNTVTFAVVPGSPLRPVGNGMYVLAATGERAHGQSLDTESVTNGGSTKFVRMKLNAFTV